ncbi:MAG: hypothetical protein HY290_26875, partial [Planctomycetia bacterium]|nr:hypothetical protein [Planctomycetia bacterium]
LNLSAAIDILYRGACPGGLLQPLRRKQHPPLFEAADGSSPGLEPVITVSADAQQAADGQYTQLLAGLDAQIIFEGAGTTALVPAGNEPRLPQVISQLPLATFKPAGPQIQPVVVRSAQLGSSTWLYAVNGSSLPVAVELVLDCPATTVARLLTDADSTSLRAAPGKGSRVRFELAGNGLWAAELDSAGASVSETQVMFADEVLADMKQRIDRLQTNMKSAAQSRPRLSPETRAQAKNSRGALQAAAWEMTVRQADSFDGDEVRQLTKTVSSVKLAWEEGRYADCQRMLEGYWSQLLLSVPAESPPASSPRPKMTERLRDRLKR